MAMTNSEDQWLTRALRLIAQVNEPSNPVSDCATKDSGERAAQYLIRILNDIEGDFPCELADCPDARSTETVGPYARR